ncbi:hypothetical protein [Flavisolibacter tropicus]|uniref:Uncharacterized protein n=1 Tax=Flavisolibacter tropicus TaxID=1492898 RepID=A0A172U0W8_9BACT|nr:hypothetical protein [Flavisolibacter tropicus]ANE52828.1 hypothetical protein SY85_22475 [Flavisolibacter tropicus]
MKNLQKVIAQKLAEQLNNYGFVYKNKNSLVKDDDVFFTEIGLDSYSNGTSYYFTLIIIRTFKRMEKMIAPKLDIVDKMRRLGSSSETLRFDENTVRGIYNVGTRYGFEPTEAGIEKLMGDVLYVFKHKFFPLLNTLQSYEDLHAFINTPPEYYEYNCKYFSFDGGILFRKMIVAKLVNKDYDAVCDWVLNDMIEQRMKAADKDQYERYKGVYYDLKEQLDKGEY